MTREVYFNGDIFPLDDAPTPEEALAKFAASIVKDGYKRPRKGSFLPVRETMDDEWVDVRVT